MGSMHTGLEELGEPGFKRLAEYFKERAIGGVGMMITGGTGPSLASSLGGNKDTALYSPEQIPNHRLITEAVHSVDAECKICLQLMHVGNMGGIADPVSPSGIQSPISRDKPRVMSEAEIQQTIEDFANSAALATQAGYDGVEIIGSAGYLLSLFLLEKTNKRTDDWGGSYENRMRFPLEIVKAVRAAVGKDFIVIFRVAAMEMMEDGSSWDEVVTLAKALEAAGVTIISTHFTWHQASVPTISTRVPRAAFASVTGRLRKELSIPVITSNRINMPDVAEQVLADGMADIVSMTRPMLADPGFTNKTREGREDEINTCIACNQACLDQTARGAIASCLVNPRAAHETELNYEPTDKSKRIAVVGAGPAGLSFSVVAAQRGHNVTLFEKSDEIGGHFNLAKRIPGKEEFHETIRYYKGQLELYGVDVRLNHAVDKQTLADGEWDDIVISTGIHARVPAIEGITHKSVVSYTEAILGTKPLGKKIAIIGAGGIGFDVAELASHKGTSAALDIDVFAREWGIDFANHPRGGVAGVIPQVEVADREIYLLQRKPGSLGKTLGPTTGWTHKLSLKRRGVHMLSGVNYEKIDDQGLHVSVDGEAQLLNVDAIVICAGQESERGLFNQINSNGKSVHLIGGAELAAEIDAKRAIDQGCRLAATL